MMTAESDRPEMAFFDVETTVPTQSGQGFAMLEFGAILVCPKKLVELKSYSTFVRPSDLSLISSLSARINGITKDAVVSAPSFSEIADKVYDLLHGRVWAGHNILRFDCPRIKEAFSRINRPPPEPKGIIDSLPLLTQRFGRRAGDMKMATLATYFGLGQQTHRSLDDVRLNLEVLKYCATVLFLESSFPDKFTDDNCVSPNATTSRGSNGKSFPEDSILRKDLPSCSTNTENHPPPLLSHDTEGNHPILSLVSPCIREDDPCQEETKAVQPNPLDLGVLSEVARESLGSDDTMDEFLQPDEVIVPCISAVLSPFYRGTQRIQLLHKNMLLQLHCHLKVLFGISTKFVDYAGRPRLCFVVNAPPSLCHVLDACDAVAQKLCIDSGGGSEWRPVVTRRPGFSNSPTVRLHLPTIADGDVARWTTEIYKKESSNLQRLVFSRFDVSELDALINPGIFVDAYFSLDPYDYLQNAGIRLVVKKLIVNSG